MKLAITEREVVESFKAFKDIIVNVLKKRRRNKEGAIF